jgi:hypothetical protein
MENCRTNSSEFRGAGCRRSKRALPAGRKERALRSLTLKRANTSRVSGQWSDDDYDALKNGVDYRAALMVPIAPAERP